MAIEIERKFIVNKELWEKIDKPKGNALVQGYIHSDENKTIRIRTANEKGFITIKGKSRADGLSRSEFEYEIPVSDALEILNTFTDKTINKIRYKILFEGFIWEVDVFEGNNSGLIMAEIELQSEVQSFKKPDWLTQEVTGDIRFYNSYLIDNPFSTWGEVI
jgi:adenylate cyclase